MDAPALTAYFTACAAGDAAALASLLAAEPGLASARTPQGGTGLHLAVRHPGAVRVLLDRGADPNARDAGDNATPLHFAAAGGQVEVVRLLLDAGADVHGAGDLHDGGVIGWAARPGNEAVIDLLLSRGAQHHVFSAMALGRLDLVETMARADPSVLRRRRSRFENEQTPLHAAVAPPDGLGWIGGSPQPDLLRLLITLGADLDATDARGRTALALAMLRGDDEAMRLLKQAGASELEHEGATGGAEGIGPAASSVRRGVPMVSVPDVRATIQWYESIGFATEDRYEDGGEVTFARLTFGNAELTLTPSDSHRPSAVSLWFLSDRVAELHRWFKARQLRSARAVLTGDDPAAPPVPFEQDLHAPFYGGQQFSVRDLNGLELVFYQPDWLRPSGGPGGG
jgi:ankyrin repeat protein